MGNIGVRVKFRSFGLLGGVVGGLLVGVLISGPHFYEWPVRYSLSVVLLSGVGGALMGWFCLAIAAGSVAGGGAVGAVDADCGDFSEAADSHSE